MYPFVAIDDMNNRMTSGKMCCNNNLQGQTPLVTAGIVGIHSCIDLGNILLVQYNIHDEKFHAIRSQCFRVLSISVLKTYMYMFLHQT